MCESLCDWGATLCAACPNPTTIITAGTSTVVCVWDVAVNKDKLTHMKLRQVCFFVRFFAFGDLQVTSGVYWHIHVYTLRLTLAQFFFFLAIIWSHRFSDVSGGVGGPQHDSKWVL